MDKTSFNSIREQLQRARNDPKLRRNFPKELWNAIFSLIERSSLETVSKELALDLTLLKKKVARLTTSQSFPSFQEVLLKPPSSNPVVIELTYLNLKARIEGPISCLETIKDLFREG